MSYSVIQLITNAYYASGIVSREFETVSGSQVNDGLQFLNDILADKAIEKDMIPYFTKYEFFAVAAQEKYFIPNLEQLETLVFFINNVRYQMRDIGRKVYFGSSRADNINSLPFNWHLERCLGGANIFMYFKPQTNYPIQAWGSFRLTSVTINQDLNSSVGAANLGISSVAGNAQYTTANLGAATILGGGTLAAGELVVNGIDLAGTYTTLLSLQSYINNTGVIPNITAVIVGTQLMLRNTVTSITVDTLGTVSSNGLTFANFNTTNGPLTSTYLAPGTIGIGQLVVNNVDLAGEYANPVALVNYINSGVVPFISAQIIGTQFYLNSINNENITISTMGSAGFTNYITFTNFSTNNGPVNETFLPQGLDLFYINYLKFSLADRLCTEFNFVVPPGVAKQLLQYQNWIAKRSAPLDMNQTKISTFSNGNTLSYGQVNLGLGFPIAG